MATPVADRFMPPARAFIRAGAMRRLTPVLVLVSLALLCVPVVSSRADLQSKLSATHVTAGQLKAAIATETKKINAGAAAVAAAESRLASLNAETQRRQEQLASVQHRLVAARNRLTALLNAMRKATHALERNLAASYKDDEPDVTTVILKARGFAELLDTVDYLKRVGKQDATLLEWTRRTRTAVLHQTAQLSKLSQRYQTLTARLMQSRAQAAAVRGALLSRQVQMVSSRANTQAKLDKVQSQIKTIKAQIARVQRVALQAPGPPSTATTTTTATTDGASQHLPVESGGTAQPSAGAPDQVVQAIAAGNAIAGLPYIWGGGHGSFRAAGYDCSGSVSYALAAAGLLSSPLNSTGFMSWGEPGPGKWITVYANNGHAYMVIDGWRFDTSALSGGGTRFTRAMRSNAGFVARHPPGL